MTTTPKLTRERVCLLAGVERARHRRWIVKGLLPERRLGYSKLDVVRAAVLDELWTTLGPTAGEAVWRQVREDLLAPGPAEVVVNLATYEAAVARTASELRRALWRGVQVMVVDTGTRAEAATEAFGRFLDRSAPASPRKTPAAARNRQAAG